jgi:inorganic phosphate transporter, PiT family
VAAWSRLWSSSVLAVAFDVTNGCHDSSNSVAAPVATRAMRPATAVAVAAVFTSLGPVLAGTAVADTVGGLISVGTADTVKILSPALLAAVTWNLATWWWGLPSSSSHALVGGLVGAGMAVGGVDAIHWGGVDGWRPAGVAGVLVALAVSPVVGGLAGWSGERAAAWSLRRARRGVTRLLLRGEWVTSSALAFAHGTNDAQKTMGLITLALVATGSLDSFVVPLWVKLVCALALTAGTALGGWRIVRTLGRGIYRIRPLDGLMSQAASTLVIGGGAALGAPVSTTHVVASSVVGVGVGRRWRHVRWPVVREIGLAWVVTLPACAGVGATLAWVEGVVG